MYRRVFFITILLLPLAIRAEVAAPFSIQEKIDQAEPGAVIVIPPGHYYGNLVIDKPLTLRGEDLPHIEGEQNGKTIGILAPDVTIDGFRISHSGLNLSRDEAGIHVQGDRAVLKNNLIHDSLHGVYVREANSVEIHDNEIRGIQETAIENLSASSPGATDDALCVVGQDRRGNGIHFWNSSGNLITGNRISNTRDGIYFSFTSESTIENNHVFATRYGLHYMYSDDNYFAGNLFEDNVAGAALMFSKNVVVHGNHFTKNSGSRAYGLLLHNVDRSIIQDNDIDGNSTGIYMQDSHANETRRNRVAHNYVGMRLTSNSTNNLFHNNDIGFNLHNIYLAGRNNNNSWTKDGRGNIWANAAKLDLDGDGVSEIPHREIDLIGDRRDTFPLISLLTESPALKALQFALQRAPIPNTHYITDEYPLTGPSK